MTFDSEALAEPFPHSDVHWRVGGTNKKAFENGDAAERKGLPVAYIDARNVMQRLDDVVGPAGWRDSYQETSKRLLCKIEILIDSEWIGKTDGAGDTDIEGQKGGISDAFKRAAVKWGIGRYLYGNKTEWVDLSDRWQLPRDFDGSLHLSSFVSKAMKTKYWKGLRDAASENDCGKARELWEEMNSEQQMEVWRDFSSGIRSSIKELLDANKPAKEAA